MTQSRRASLLIVLAVLSVVIVPILNLFLKPINPIAWGSVLFLVSLYFVSRTRYFNTAAFVDRTNPGGPFRYGTVPRNSLIGPGIVSLDASANKRFSLGGSKVIELRIEVFNLPNTPIWNQPGNQLRTPTFGVITSTRIDSRQIQIGVRLSF